jgi:hypothetical protein
MVSNVVSHLSSGMSVRVVRAVRIVCVSTRNFDSTKVRFIVRIGGAIPVSREIVRNVRIKSTSVLEKTTSINEGVRVFSNFRRSAKSVDGVGEGINGISVVEGLSSKNLEKSGVASERRAVVYVLIGLNNPNKLLHGVIEVKLDLVAGRTNGLIASELKLADEVLVRVLGHTTALICVEEHIVNV